MTNFLAHLVQRTLEPSAGVQPRRSNPFEPTRFEPPLPAAGPIEAEHATARFDVAGELPGKHNFLPNIESLRAQGRASDATPGDSRRQQDAVGANSTNEANARVTDAEQNPAPSDTAAPTVQTGQVGVSRQSPGDEHVVDDAGLPQYRRPNKKTGGTERATSDAAPGLDSMPVAASLWSRTAVSPAQTADSVTLEAREIGASAPVLRSDSSRLQSGGAQAQPRSWEPEHRTSVRASAEHGSNASQLKASSLISAKGISPLLLPEQQEPHLAEGMAHAPSGQSAPTVHVTIGTLEVRAITASTVGTQPSKRAAPAKPSMSLTDYLERRSGGRR